MSVFNGEDEKQKISRDFSEERGRETKDQQRFQRRERTRKKKKKDQQIFQRRGNATLESAIKAVKEDGPEMTFYNHYTER